MSKTYRPPGRLIQHLEKLPGFIHVVEAGSFHAAALRARVTQPSLSRSIRSLEDALEMELLIRGRKGIEPTEAGRRLYEYARGLAASAEDAEHRLLSPDSEISGRIRIGTFESLIPHLWPGVLKRLRERHPQLSVALSSCSSLAQEEGIARGSLKIAVGSTPSPSRDCIVHDLYRDRYRLYAPRAWLRTRKPLNELPLFYAPAATDGAGVPLSSHLSSLGLAFASVCDLDTFESAKQLCLRGLGACVLPERVAAADVARGALDAVRLPGIPEGGFGEHRISAFFRRIDEPTPRVEAVLSALLEETRLAARAYKH